MGNLLFTLSLVYKTLLIASLLLANILNLKANEEYLKYDLPDEVDQYGPISTRDRKETYTKYYSKSEVRSHQSLLCIKHHRNEVLVKKSLYKEGRLHGLQKEWYPNGQIKQELAYFKGKLHGTCRHWSENGELLGQYEMKQGTGTLLIFTPGGNISKLSHFFKQKKVGISIDVGLSYLLFFHYNDNAISGKSFSYTKNHKLKRIRYFQGDQLTGVEVKLAHSPQPESIHFYSKGEIISKLDYKRLRTRNKDLPPALDSVQQYKELLNDEASGLISLYTSWPTVKIPLEFNNNGDIMTQRDQPFSLPKSWRIQP